MDRGHEEYRNADYPALHVLVLYTRGRVFDFGHLRSFVLVFNLSHRLHMTIALAVLSRKRIYILAFLRRFFEPVNIDI